MARLYRHAIGVAQFIQLVVLIWTATQWHTAQAGSMTAWYTGHGAPQIIIQDDATGKIMYSVCNSNTTPIFPTDEPLTLDIEESVLPRNGTALSGTGYYGGEYNFAAMQWQTADGSIVLSLWSCDATGHFYNTDFTIISTDAPSVHPETGLMNLLLGQYAGYRLYYQDEDNATASLTYDPERDNWDYGGVISHDPIYNFQIGAGFVDNDRISVAVPRDEGNIEMMTMRDPSTWELSTFPRPLNHNTTNTTTSDPDSDTNTTTTTFTPLTNATSPDLITLNASSPVTWSLPAWDGSARGLGLALDPDGVRNLFYIGNDSSLHQVREILPTSEEAEAAEEAGTVAASAWEVVDAPGDDGGEWKWPAAAEGGNGRFALAYDYSLGAVWIYYFVATAGDNATTESDPVPKTRRQAADEEEAEEPITVSFPGVLTEVRRSSTETWEDAVALPVVNTAETPPAEPSTSSSSGNGGGGLSQSAKIGIGVGVGVGGALLLASGAWLFLARRRKNQRIERERAAAARDDEVQAKAAAEIERRDREAAAAAAAAPIPADGGEERGPGRSPELPAPPYSSNSSPDAGGDGQWGLRPAPAAAPVELPGRDWVHEVPGHVAAQEMDGKNGVVKADDKDMKDVKDGE